MTGFLCLKSGNIKEWLLLEWKILNTHLMFDWMTSLCWRGWVWYDGLRRSSSLVTRFGAFFNDVIIIITWRAGSYPPETDSPCPCHCRSWWCPPCWWSHRPGIRAPLEMSCQKYPGTCLYWPWTESTLSWNPWDTAPRPDLNSTQRLLLCPGTRGLYLYQTTLGAHQSGWPGAGWSCSWRRLSWTGPCQTETPSARRSSPGAETVCKGNVTGSSGSGSGVTWAESAALSGCGQATLSTCTPPPSGEYSSKLSRQDICDDTHWKLSGVVRWLHDSHPLLQSHIYQHWSLCSLVTLA